MDSVPHMNNTPIILVAVISTSVIHLILRYNCELVAIIRLSWWLLLNNSRHYALLHFLHFLHYLLIHFDLVLKKLFVYSEVLFQIMVLLFLIIYFYLETFELYLQLLMFLHQMIQSIVWIFITVLNHPRTASIIIAVTKGVIFVWRVYTRAIIVRNFALSFLPGSRLQIPSFLGINRRYVAHSQFYVFQINIINRGFNFDTLSPLIIYVTTSNKFLCLTIPECIRRCLSDHLGIVIGWIRLLALTCDCVAPPPKQRTDSSTTILFSITHLRCTLQSIPKTTHQKIALLSHGCLFAAPPVLRLRHFFFRWLSRTLSV